MDIDTLEKWREFYKGHHAGCGPKLDEAIAIIRQQKEALKEKDVEIDELEYWRKDACSKWSAAKAEQARLREAIEKALTCRSGSGQIIEDYLIQALEPTKGSE